jgi:hypothetical protein
MCTQIENPSPETELEELVVGQEPIPGGFEPQEAESALEALTPALMAIPPVEVRPFYVGATPAVGLGLAYAEAYAEDRPRFDEAFKPAVFDPVQYDDLGQRAMAFWQADIQMRQELNSDGPFRLMVLEAKPLRKKLIKNASFLWGEDPELGEVVAAIRKGHGHQDTADDLGALHELFSEHWDRAAGKCEVTLEEVARAEELGAAMLQALSPTRSEELDEARDLRNRAAEHLRRGFEEVRAAALYVFRNNESRLERYPSMFVLRRKRSSSSAADDEESTGSGSTPSGPETDVSDDSAATADQQAEGVEALAPEA